MPKRTSPHTSAYLGALCASFALVACGDDSGSTGGGGGGGGATTSSDVTGSTTGATTTAATTTATTGTGGEGGGPGCPQGLTECSGQCVDTDVDGTNCGDCGVTCDPGQVCNGSGDCALSCQQGLIDCGGTCVDPNTDESFCGAGPDCSANPGSVCAAGEVCNGSGVCELSCQPGLIDCNGTCVDPDTDESFCGAGPDCSLNPGAVCAAGEICNGAGVCELTCQGGLIDCNGTCVDPDTDESFCGAGPDCSVSPGAVCGPAESCINGTCDLICPPGLTECSGQCVDGDNDPQFCGAGPDCVADPGVVCPNGQACVTGACVPLQAGCDINTAALSLPVTVHPSNFYGGIAFDANCDLLVSGNFFDHTLYRMNRLTGAVTTVATGLGSPNGVAYRPADGGIYVASDGPPRLYRIVGGAPQTVINLPTTLNDIAIAPAGFGAYGGQIIGVGFNSIVYAIDPAVPSITQIGQTSGILSDLVFAPNGSTLYIANNSNSTIQTMSSAGVFATFASGLSSIDGIAINAAGTQLIAAHYAGGSRLSTVSVPGAVVADYATVPLDGGFYTTGVLVDTSGSVIMKSQSGGNAAIIAP